MKRDQDLQLFRQTRVRPSIVSAPASISCVPKVAGRDSFQGAVCFLGYFVDEVEAFKVPPVPRSPISFPPLFGR